jgi:hypothetical protein
MDPTLIRVFAFSHLFFYLSFVFFHVDMSLGSLGNRKFGVCEGFPYLGGQVTTPESLYLRSSDYPRLLHSIAPFSSLYI